jgi:hypothetical protein
LSRYLYPWGGAPGSTSEVLRKILVAGAAIAALSVVANQKPAVEAEQEATSLPETSE